MTHTYDEDWERLERATGAKIPDEVQRRVETEWESGGTSLQKQHHETFSVFARVRCLEIARERVGKTDVEGRGVFGVEADLSEMTAEELTKLAARAGDLARAKRKAEAQAQKRLAKLREQLDAAEGHVSDLRRAIADLEAGRVPARISASPKFAPGIMTARRTEALAKARAAKAAKANRVA
jgi:hypothetical protein